MDLTCKICVGSDDSGILNKAGSSISRDISVSVDWLCCDICDGWHHNQCLRNLNVLLFVSERMIYGYAPYVIVVSHYNKATLWSTFKCLVRLSFIRFISHNKLEDKLG